MKGGAPGTMGAGRLLRVRIPLKLAHSMKVLIRPNTVAQKRQQPALLPWLTLLFLGSAALGLYFLIAPALTGERYYKVGLHANLSMYVRQILLLFVPYLFALRAWRKGARVPMYLLLGGAVLLHLIVLFAPPPQSQDFYSYLFYGRIQAAHGANPYIALPNQFWADPWFPWTRWHDQTSVYGPVWMLITWGIGKTAGTSMTLAFVELKLVILAIDLTVMGLLVAAGKSHPEEGSGAGWPLLLFAWNPLVLITVPLAGAADVWLAATFIGAVMARRRGRTGLATLLLTLAALVKIYAVVAILLHLVLVLRERGRARALQHAAVAAGISAVAFAPYWAGLKTFGGLWGAVKLANLSLTGTVQRVVGVSIHHFMPRHLAWVITEFTVRLAVAALLTAVGVWAVRTVRDERSFWWATLVFLTVYLFVTPWFMYWYLIAPLALVAILPINPLTYPLVTFSATSLVAVWFRPRLLGNIVQTGLRYVPPVVVLTRKRRLAATRRVGGAPASFPVPASATATARAPAAK
jgi:hypothetical protein